MSWLYMTTCPHLQLLQFTVNVHVKVWIHGQEMFCQHTKPARRTEFKLMHVHSCLSASLYMQIHLFNIISQHDIQDRGFHNERPRKQGASSFHVYQCCHLVAGVDTGTTITDTMHCVIILRISSITFKDGNTTALWKSCLSQFCKNQKLIVLHSGH